VGQQVLPEHDEDHARGAHQRGRQAQQAAVEPAAPPRRREAPAQRQDARQREARQRVREGRRERPPQPRRHRLVPALAELKRHGRSDMFQKPDQVRTVEAEQRAPGRQRLGGGAAAELQRRAVGQRVDDDEHQRADQRQRRGRDQQAPQQRAHPQSSAARSGKPASRR
jgi:hypothetical protein